MKRPALLPMVLVFGVFWAFVIWSIIESGFWAGFSRVYGLVLWAAGILVVFIVRTQGLRFWRRWRGAPMESESYAGDGQPTARRWEIHDRRSDAGSGRLRPLTPLLRQRPTPPRMDPNVGIERPFDPRGARLRPAHRRSAG